MENPHSPRAAEGEEYSDIEKTIPLYRRAVLKGAAASPLAAAGLPAVADDVAAQQTSDEDWPQFQFDTGNTGHNPDGTGPTTGVGTLWNPFSTGDHVTSPVVVNGVIYVGSGDGNVYAVDAADGSHQWSFGTGGTVWAPAVDAGTVYVGSRGGHVHALDASDGTEQWRWPFPKGGASAAPTVANGVVYAPGADDRFFALDASDGSERWRIFTGECAGGQVQTPAIVDGVVYITEDCGKTWALNASDGSVQWKFDDGSGRGQASPPTVVDGTVYFGTVEADSPEGNTVFAVDASSGTEQWRFTFTPEGDVKSSPAVANGTVFFGSDNGIVYALNASDGTKVWEFATGDRVTSSPAVVNGVVYIGSEDGNLYLLDASSGEEIDQFGTGGAINSSPAVANSNIYVGSRDSNLYGLEGGEANDAPTAAFDFTPDNPVVGEEVTFDPSASSDPDGSISTFGWDFDGDGNFDKTVFSDEKVTHTYSEAGDFSVTLKVTDDDGATDETTKTVSVSKINLELQEESVRLVQTVEDTHVTQIGFQEEDPDIIAGRNASVAFNFESIENPKQLSDEVEVQVIRDKEDDPPSFHLSSDDIRKLDGDPEDPDSLVVLNDDNPDRKENTDVPVFSIANDISSVTVKIPDSKKINGDEFQLTEGNHFTVRGERHLRVGFISVYAPDGGPNFDPEQGVSYGFIPEKDSDDPRIAGGPLRYKSVVDNAVEYLKRVYPVSELTVYRHDIPIKGTDQQGEPDIDYQNARIAFDLALEDPHFPAQGEMIVGEASDLQEEGFSATVLIVPNADVGTSYDPELSSDWYYQFHGMGGTLGQEPRGRASAAGMESILNPLIDMSTVAHEMGHHFAENRLYFDAPNHPMAQRDDDGSDTLLRNIDWDHARARDSDFDNDGNLDEPGVISTGFDFVDGDFKLVNGFGINTQTGEFEIKSPSDTDDDGILEFEQRESFMSYAMIRQQFEDEVWADSRIYQHLIEQEFDNPDQEGEVQPVLSLRGHTSNIEFSNVFKHPGIPESQREGSVSLELLDTEDNILIDRNVPDTLELTFQNGTRMKEGVVMATLPFPEETEVLVAKHDGVETRINPIERSVRDAINAIPDAGFINRPEQRREALFNKLDAIDRQMEQEKFRAAKRKMKRDIRDKLERWLRQNYDSAANQPTKQDMLNLVDDMIFRLETLANGAG